MFSPLFSPNTGNIRLFRANIPVFTVVSADIGNIPAIIVSAGYIP